MTRPTPLICRSRRAWRLALYVVAWTAAACSLWAVTQLSAAPGSAGQSARPVRNDEDLKQLIVMLQGTLAEQVINGAGIIIGQGSDRLYVATANHVVRQGSQQIENLQVQFKWLPGEPKGAKLLERQDPDLDLAVLAVAPARELAIPDLAWAALSNPSALATGQKVFPIGFPAGMVWDKPQQHHLVHSVPLLQILSDGSFVAGHSGGALVTEEPAIVGMVSKAGSLRAESTRIDRVIDKLKEWGYPIELTFKTSSTTVDEKPIAPKPSDPKPPDPKTDVCAMSGLVFDRESNRPLSAVNIGLAWNVPGARPETLVRTVATSGPDGRFSFECPGGIAGERFPLHLVLSHPDWGVTQHTNVEVQPGQRRTQVNVPTSVPRARRDSGPGTISTSDDCVYIDPASLKVEFLEGRGGWHLVASVRGVGQVLLPAFDTNESGARTAAGVVQRYGVTQYCQIGRPPSAFYFLVRGVPARDRLPGERCQSFNPAGLMVIEPGTVARTPRWSIGEAGRPLLQFSDAQVARSALEIIGRHGFTSICYPARPMMYLR
jgi:hypothetical protein